MLQTSRIEAETRNVQTLMTAGSLEEAASSACSLFDTCQEAGLLVSTAQSSSSFPSDHLSAAAASFCCSSLSAISHLCCMVSAKKSLTGAGHMQAEAVRLLILLADIHMRAEQPTAALPYALSAVQHATQLRLDVMVSTEPYASCPFAPFLQSSGRTEVGRISPQDKDDS